VTTDVHVPKAWNRLAIASPVLGLLSLLSSWERLLAISYQSHNFGELAGGRLWDQVPQVHFSVFCGGLLLGIGAIVIGIVSLVQVRNEKMRGTGSAIAGIILGSVAVGAIQLLLAVQIVIQLWITGCATTVSQQG
jgi:hypothetical protein